MTRLRLLIAAAGLAAAAGAALAQSPDRFTARLSWVPVSAAQLNVVGGEGSATATLSRSRLVIEGSFRDLPAAATAARLHQGVATGAKGPAIAGIEITQASAGTFEAAVELDRAQRAALLAGRLYVQIHAENGVPPDNAVLRGWLLVPRTSDARR